MWEADEAHIDSWIDLGHGSNDHLCAHRLWVSTAKLVRRNQGMCFISRMPSDVAWASTVLQTGQKKEKLNSFIKMPSRKQVYKRIVNITYGSTRVN